jgi:hypothetical protein
MPSGDPEFKDRSDREIISESSSNIHDDFEYQMQSRILMESQKN